MLIPEGYGGTSRFVLKFIKANFAEISEAKFKRVDSSPEMEELFNEFENKVKFKIINSNVSGTSSSL